MRQRIRNLYTVLLSWVLMSFDIRSRSLAYEDLRGKPCMNMDLFNIIPKENVDWDGIIQIEMSCNPGFDRALNGPASYLFNCKPGGSQWDPPIFPDCNELTVPTSFRLLIAAEVPISVCSTMKEKSRLEKNQEVLQISTGDVNTTVTLCDVMDSLSDCKVRNVTWKCDLDSPRDYISKDFKWRKSNVNVVLTTSFMEIPDANIREIAERIAKRLKDAVQQVYVWPNDHKSSLKVDCKPGTLPMARPENRDVVCRGCSLGHYLQTEKRKCLPCAAGYYNDEPMQTECKICPALKDNIDKVVWERVQKMKDGAYTHSLCPTLKRNVDGTLKVVAPFEDSKALKYLRRHKEHSRSRAQLPTKSNIPLIIILQVQTSLILVLFNEVMRIQ